jgi:ATP-dependent Zn protease
VVEFARPSEDQRRQLFELYLNGVPHSLAAAGIEHLAEIATRATGADIRDWISQAASEALAETDVDDPLIEYRHLETVVARRGFVAAKREAREPLWSTAIHEAAHSVVAWHLFGREALAKVQLGFGRGPDELGSFNNGHFELSEDWLQRHPPTTRNWADHVAVGLAGACAEQVILGERSPGSEIDVSSATESILEQLERGDTAFGPARKALEKASVAAAVGSEAMRSVAWHLVSRRFDECWRGTSAHVAQLRDQIERLARVLFEEKRTLTADEIVAAIEPADSKS